MTFRPLSPFRPFDPFKYGTRTLASQVRALFANGEQGAIYGTDFSTLFQDAAGAVPVTAVEQQVGYRLDMSGRGNHLVQATATKRAYVSRRVNLLTNTTLFGAISGSPGTAPTGWLENLVGTSGGVLTTSPGDVGNQVIGLDTTSAAARHFFRQTAGPLIANAKYDFSIQIASIPDRSGTPLSVARIIGAAALPTGATAAEYLLNGSIVDGLTAVPNDGDTVGVRVTLAGTSGTVEFRFGLGLGSSVSRYIAFTKPSLTLAIESHLPYQWVNTATDYDADPGKFPTYIKYELDDSYQSIGNIDFTGTDKMTVWAGITTFGVTAGILVNHGIGGPLFWLGFPGNAVPDNIFNAQGTASRNIRKSASLSPSSSTYAAGADIAANNIYGQENGVPWTVISGASLGTGNFANSLLTVGSAHGGTSAFFNGRDYGLIIRGAQSSPHQLDVGNRYLKQQMRLP